VHSAQATLSIARVKTTEDSVECGRRVLGLLGDIRVAHDERFVPGHQVAPISHHPRHECPNTRRSAEAPQLLLCADKRASQLTFSRRSLGTSCESGDAARAWATAFH